VVVGEGGGSGCRLPAGAVCRRGVAGKVGSGCRLVAACAGGMVEGGRCHARNALPVLLDRMGGMRWRQGREAGGLPGGGQREGSVQVKEGEPNTEGGQMQCTGCVWKGQRMSQVWRQKGMEVSEGSR